MRIAPIAGLSFGVMFVLSLAPGLIASFFPLGPLPSFAFALPLGIFLILLTGRFRSDKGFIFSLTPYFMFCCLSAFWSLDIGQSMRTVFLLMMVAVYCLLLANAVLVAGVERSLAVLKILALLVPSLSLILYYWGTNSLPLMIGNEGAIAYGVLIEKGIYRLVGVHYDPNFMALISLFFVAASLYLMNGVWKPIAVILNAVVIALTLSRAGAACLILLLVFWFFRQGLSIKRLLVLGGVILVIALLLFSLDVDTLNLALEKRSTGLESGAGRFDIWANSLQGLYKNPFFGVGFGGFRTFNLESFADAHYAHNNHLEVLVEIGAIGFLFYIGFLFFVFLLFFARRLGSDLSKNVSVFSQGYLFVLLAMLTSLTAYGNAFVYASIAVCLAILRGAQTQRSEAEHRGAQSESAV